MGMIRPFLLSLFFCTQAFNQTYSIETAESKRKYEVIHFPSLKPQPVIIYLHGLQEQEEVFSAKQKQIWEQKAKEHQFILVAPLGLKGSFDKEPNAYGWFPHYAEENFAFLQKLIIQIRKDFSIDQQAIILYGYSNGAYFGANQLQKKSQAPFTHYWLQGGGISEEVHSDIIYKPVVLQVGINDQWHFTTIESLNQHLSNNGWILGKNLLFQKLNSNHGATFEKFDEAYQFFVSRKH